MKLSSDTKLSVVCIPDRERDAAAEEAQELKIAKLLTEPVLPTKRG
jgi:hypothetical protein